MNKQLSIKSLLLCLILLLGSMAQAQSLARQAHKPTSGGNECIAIPNPNYERLMKQLGQGELRAFPSRVSDDDRLPIIPQNEHIYKLRLAVAISKSSYWSAPFNSNKEQVKQYLDNLQWYLNNIYERDCGVRFEIIRDDRLILTAEKYAHTYGYMAGTDIFNEILGRDKYDIGIIIRPAQGGLQGQAILGGVTNHREKGQAVAISDNSTVAHELGHLLGADHTHERHDGLYLEQGEGQSAMSYGAPRGFFALASVRSIRATLASMSYYTDEQRTQLVKGIGLGDNQIVRLPFTGERPKLDRKKLKREYKVPPNTFFQFRIPTTNSNTEGFHYVAHPFDISKFYGEYANFLQPTYPGVKEPLCTFHTRYEAPYRGQANEERVYPYSNQFFSGVYTYVLSAFNQGHHDAFRTKLNIVWGAPPFKIKKVENINYTTDAAYAGSELKITWTPCTEVYGNNSKVRILLSDDFGKTFKHVLAENVPNNGTWVGAWPYLNIGQRDYPNYVTEPGWGSAIGAVRAGVIKIEVVGEVAYDLSHVQPYRMQGTTKINTGGFLLKIDNNRSLTFKTMSGQAPPAQYMEVKDIASVPSKESLKAMASNGTTAVVQCEEKIEGNIITRKWVGNIGGRRSTYAQLIKVLGESSNIPEYMIELSGIEERVKDLYRHIGKLAYPKENLSESQDFKTAYRAVYDDDGNVRHTTTTEQVKTLSAALTKIGNIADDDIVMPISGSKYKLMSYHKTYKGEKRYYLNPRAGYDEEQLVGEKDKAAIWSLQEVDGIYRFISDGQGLKLKGVERGYSGVKLVRGFTWGAFSIISPNQKYIAQINSSGTVISINDVYATDPITTRTNQPGISVSTDFKLELVDESFDIYFQAKSWTSVQAYFALDNKPTLTTTLVGDKLYKVSIPKGYGLERVRFTDGSSNVYAQLIGRSATYNEEGRRTHSVTIGTQSYSTLYLDYPVSIPNSVKAFTATAEPQGQGSNKEYHLKLQALSGVIPARTAVLLYSDTPQTYVFDESLTPGTKVGANVLVGSTEIVRGSTRDNNNYLYFDLSKPSTGNPASEGQTLSFKKLADNVDIAAHTAYYLLYKYATDQGGDGNYSVTTTKLSTDEFGKKVTDTPPPSKPEEPKEPKPEPTPAPAPEPPTPPTPPTPDPQPNPPTPVEPPVSPTPPTPPVDPAPAPTPTPDPVEPTSPAPTPDPVPPTEPKDGAGDSDVDGSGDEDNTPDPNGSVDGQPNVPIGEDGTIDRPYSARSITSLEMGGKAIWLRGRVLGWLTADGRLQSKPTESIALGEDSKTYVPVFIPKVYRMQVQSLSTQALLVEGVLSDYLRGRGISDKGFRSLRAEGVVFAPNATTTDSPEASEVSPYDYTGYIYDLSGRIVGKGNFVSLPRGVYILGGKKYIKR